MRLPTFPAVLKGKREFFELYQRGRLGNTLRTWDRLEDCPDNVLLMARHMGVLGGGVCISNLSKDAMRRRAFRTRLDLSKMRFNECAPDALASLQGEVFEGPGGLELFAHVRALRDVGKAWRMRDVLPKAKQYHGLNAQHLLRSHLSPASYEDVRELLALFPDHVVEFAAYSRSVGWASGRNTIVWEVRLY